MTKRIVPIASAALIVATGVFLLVRGNAAEQVAGRPKPPPWVQIHTAISGPITEIAELNGSIEPYRLARVASPAEGPVAELLVREGDHVVAGALLLTIGRREGAVALIASLREEVRKEEENLRNTEALVETDALAGEQLDRARSDYERVRAQLVRAEESGRDHQLRAPWGGVVSRVLVKEGDFVAPRTPLVELYDPASLVIRAAAPERYATRVRDGMTIDLTLDAYPDLRLHGRVVRVYAYLDDRTRTRTFEVAPTAEVDLLPGMFARLRLPLRSVDDAILVPREAVMVDADGRSAAFVVEEGQARRRIVSIGIEEGPQVQVVAGIAPGDSVVVAGQERLRDGVSVRVIKPAPPGGPRDKPGTRSEDARPEKSPR